MGDEVDYKLSTYEILNVSLFSFFHACQYIHWDWGSVISFGDTTGERNILCLCQPHAISNYTKSVSEQSGDAMPMMVLMRKIQVMLLAVVEQLCCYFLINTVAVAREIIYKPRRYLLCVFLSYLRCISFLSFFSFLFSRLIFFNCLLLHPHFKA